MREYNGIPSETEVFDRLENWKKHLAIAAIGMLAILVASWFGLNFI